MNDKLYEQLDELHDRLQNFAPTVAGPTAENLLQLAQAIDDLADIVRKSLKEASSA